MREKAKTNKSRGLVAPLVLVCAVLALLTQIATAGWHVPASQIPVSQIAASQVADAESAAFVALLGPGYVICAQRAGDDAPPLPHQKDCGHCPVCQGLRATVWFAPPLGVAISPLRVSKLIDRSPPENYAPISGVLQPHAQPRGPPSQA